MTRTGDREIGVISGKFLDNPGELACMQFFKFSAKVTMSLWLVFPDEIS